ncbi:MAG: ribosomal L7Ae/L30e/S12e/Gadd45 family protein [Lachnospiraceae bacterium]|nr:ribosomal L7Ae/L30e/S12e/Gadd45 family protein [Lachnospiraceae bacterium]
MRDKAFGMLGLAQRAGAVKSGEFMTENTIKAGSARLVIVAGDSSANTKKHFTDMCDHRNIPIRFFSDMENLGHCIGREFRASLAVTDEGLAGKILSIIDQGKKDEVL